VLFEAQNDLIKSRQALSASGPPPPRLSGETLESAEECVLVIWPVDRPPEPVMPPVACAIDGAVAAHQAESRALNLNGTVRVFTDVDAEGDDISTPGLTDYSGMDDGYIERTVPVMFDDLYVTLYEVVRDRV